MKPRQRRKKHPDDLPPARARRIDSVKLTWTDRPGIRFSSSDSSGGGSSLLAALVLAALVSSLGGCASPTPIARLLALPVPPSTLRSVPLPDDEWVSVAGMDRFEVDLAANDFTGFSLAIQTGELPLPSPTLRWNVRDEDGNTGAPFRFQLFLIQSVPVRQLPGWHHRTILSKYRRRFVPDVLVPIEAPRGGLPPSIPPHSTLFLWADVKVTEFAPAESRVVPIELLSSGQHVATLPVRLRVHPVRIPDDTTFTALADLDHRLLFAAHVLGRQAAIGGAMDDWLQHSQRKELDHLLSSTFRMLRDHRIVCGLPRLSPKVRMGPAGKLEVDWSAYDITVRPLLLSAPSALRTPFWPVPLDPVRSSFARPAVDSDLLVRVYLESVSSHFQPQGWLPNSYAALPWQIRPGVVSPDPVKRLASLAKSVAPTMTVVCDLASLDLAPLGCELCTRVDFSSQVDIWAPPAQFLERRVPAADNRLQSTWMRPDRPPFSGSLSYLAPGTQPRVLPWQAQLLGASALHLGTINNWPEVHPSADPEGCLRFDEDVLLYPGTPFGLSEPVPSLRLKLLRQGLIDVAMGAALSASGRDHIRSALVQALSPYAGLEAARTSFADGRPNGWQDDWQLFEDARRIMLAELSSQHEALPQGTSEFPGSTRARVDWLGLMSRTRRRDLRAEGTRIRFTGSAKTPSFQMETSLSLRNGGRIPWNVRIGLDFPNVWPSVDAEPINAQVPINEFRRVVLAAQTPSIPWSDTKRHSPQLFLEDDDASRRIALRIPFVTASPCAFPPSIDGDLTDWLPGSSNVAAGFSLVTWPHELEESASRQPTSSTSVFVMYDRRNLYIAVNCELSGPLPQPDTTRTAVLYDDFIPIGEELIDILLDPLNAGTRSPSDLYHLVVKSSGPASAEKGLRLNPPVGQYGSWAADFDSATRISPGRWTAEIRIPFDAFPTASGQREIWGFNVARFDLVHQEFSTWSGAAGNAYDPISLGNLFLP